MNLVIGWENTKERGENNRSKIIEMQERQSMINSAQEFIFLCNSQQPSDITRSLREDASLEVWRDLVINFRTYEIDVAQNEKIPDEIISILIDQGNEVVRAILAEKRRLPVNFYYLLFKDPSSLVRKKIAANRKTPIHIVKNLVHDIDDDVASVAKFRLIFSAEQRATEYKAKKTSA